MAKKGYWPALLGALGGAAAGVQFIRASSPTNVFPNSTPISSGGTKLLKRTASLVVQGSGDADGIYVTFTTRYINTTVEQALGNALTVSASIGLYGETTSVPVKWAGVSSVSIADGTYKLRSDFIPYSSFATLVAGGKIPQGQEFKVIHDELVAVAGQKFLCSQIPYATVKGALSIILDPATFDGTFAVGNHASQTTGSTGSGGVQWTNAPNIFIPILESRFTVAAGDPPTHMGVGDSLDAGQGDTISNVATSGGFRRAMHNASGDANPIGGINFCQAGTTPQWLSSALMAAWGPSCSYLYFGAGANYWLTSPGTALATVQASVLSIWANFYASETKRASAVYARKLTPRCAYNHTTSSATNVTTTATLTSADGIVPPNGTSVVLAGFTPAAYNGTFTTANATGTTFDVTLLSDPGGSATVQGTWDDNGANTGTMGYLNAQWAAGGSARLYNDWLDTQITPGKLVTVLNLTTNRQSATQSTDGFYKWIANVSPTIPSGTYGGTHMTAAGNQNERNDIRPVLQGLV